MNQADTRVSVSLRLTALGVWIAAVLNVQAQFPSRLNISLVGSHEPPQASTGYGDVWGDGNIACLGVWTAYSTFGFGIYNIANPAAPQLLNVYNYTANVQNRFEQGVIRSNICYVGCWGGSGNGSGLHILSISNPAAPVLLSRITANSPGTVINGFNDVHTLFLERNFLYEAAHNPGSLSVKVFDVSNPAAPVYVRDVVTTNTTKIHQMTVRNKGGRAILFTSGWGGNDNGAPNSPGQTDLWDVTQIGTQPAQWLGRVYGGYNAHSSWPSEDGNTLVVCREMSGGDVRLYDITNPANITSNTPPLVTITPASMGLENDIPHNPVVVGNLLFLSWYQNGLQVFDITDRTRPVRVGWYDTYPGARSSSFQGNWGVDPMLGLNRVLLSDIQSGLFIVDASATAAPTNNYPPLIVQPPASLTTTQGMNATFVPVITGSLLNYQWRFNGTNLAGAGSNQLVLNNVQSSQAGHYSIIASNASGCATSAVAVLSVVVPTGAPSITSQPQNISIYPDNDANFSVGVIGAAPLSYQWRFNGGNIDGATSNLLTLPVVHAEQVGYYSVIVTNGFGSATSSNAAIILLDSPYVSAVSATPGSHNALVSWSTTVDGDSQVQFEAATVVIQNPSSVAAAGGFSTSSYVDPALTTNHVILLTGLLPDTRYSYQVLSTADTNTYLSGVYQFTTAGTNVIDNPVATFTGTWTPATMSADKYLTNYAFASTVSGAATATATWRPNIITPGRYDVFVWYPQGGNRATNAPYLISHDGGSTNVFVNQQGGGGDWRLIAGGLEFAKGTNGFVRLSNNAGPGVVIADAARFVYVETQDFPTGPAVPAWWQKFYFGDQVEPTLDPDGDGYTTAQEYVMGTNPTNSGSRLRLAGQTGVSNSANVTFRPLLGNRAYSLLSRTNIGAATWQPATSNPPVSTSEGQGIFTLSTTNELQNYFRLKVRMSMNGDFSGLLAVPAGKSFSPFASEAFCGPNRAYFK